MNVVFIVPTGIGAEIGGHAGDATPAAKLIASVCDRLFIHPNVVNASDINGMTENMLYVEGSILDRFLEGLIGLEEVKGNKILLGTNAPVTCDVVNAVSAARATIGADIEILEFDIPIKMNAYLVDRKASGLISNLDQAVAQVSQYDFDVLVVHTPINTSDEDAIDYLSSQGGVNIWGGVEAQLSKYMSEQLNRPVIHAPVENSHALITFKGIVEPRKAAETVSVCYLHCCLIGAHVAPIMSRGNKAYWHTDIDFLVSPAGVWGRPHKACAEQGIPIIAVTENQTILDDTIPSSANVITVKNYLEAVGVICAKQAGVLRSSVIRPLLRTEVIRRAEKES